DVRDKDAVVAAMLICNMAAASFEQGETLVDRLDHVYEKYGFGVEETVSKTLEGKEGIEKIQNAMAELRGELEACTNAADASKLLGDIPVVAVRDYKTSTRYDFTSEGVTKSEITLPTSNVILYELGGDKGIDWACARPSGTEPKLKIYFGTYASDKDEAASRLAKIKGEVTGYIEGKLS
ncbi:MAG: phospho-sugar mutase, partial [Saccharofermentans sp.]|nr:phospho-sugar mutase [Saccharofermentans sp.]